MRDFILIDQDKGLVEFRKHLFQNAIEVIAVDFEGESNLHEYGERLCLIQVFDGARYFIIDPFRIGQEEIAGFLEDKKLVKLFYGSDSDLSLVYKQYGIKVKSVFDLKIMVDLLNFERKSLDSVVEKVLKVSIKEKAKYQMYNWTLRPIKEEALEYALTDVEHLFELNKALAKLVSEAGKNTELIYGVVRKRNEFDGKSIPTVFKSNEYQSLGAAKKELFKRIYDLRDRFARELNLPPNCVIAKEDLFRISRDPDGAKEISFSKRVPDRQRSLIAAALRELIKG
jgi:ribonuclease D